MIRGIYVSPESVVRSPDYAAALAGESGVNLFVLRAGFDPEQSNAALGEAARIARRVGAKACALVGAWWGHGVEARDSEMLSVCPWPDAAAASAHERQWPMRAPGGPHDERIAAALRRIAAEAALDSICLTHARFRHAADIAGLFETPRRAWGGFDLDDLREALRRADAKARTLSPIAILELSRESGGLPCFLDRLADGGGKIVAQWFDVRRGAVSLSLERFSAAAREAGGPALRFGTNSMNPFMALLCGQNAAALAGYCDFVQPLLSYSRWHILEPVLAWSDWLRTRVAGLGANEALASAKNLLGLGAVDWPQSDPEFFRGGGEGPEALIRETVRAALRRTREWQSGSLEAMPVLRGRDWPRALTRELAEFAESIGCKGVLFQGCENLAAAPPPPDQGWQ